MSEVELLDVSADDGEISDLRILVDQRHIKHLTVDPGVYDERMIYSSTSLEAALPPLPQGQWNCAHISSDPTIWRPYFSSVRIRRCLALQICGIHSPSTIWISS